MSLILPMKHDWSSKLAPFSLIALVLVAACGDDDAGPSTPRPEGTTDTSCVDGVDNDGDLLTDCDDPGCRRVCSLPFLDGGMRDGGMTGPTSCSVTNELEFFADSCTGGQMCDCGFNGCTTAGCNLCERETTCSDALPRRFRVIVTHAEVPTTKPDGSDWDLGGGAPDLYAAIARNRSRVMRYLPPGQLTAVAGSTPGQRQGARRLSVVCQWRDSGRDRG